MISRFPGIEDDWMVYGKDDTRLEDERRGFWIHAIVALFVITLLAVINMLTLAEFPWFLFPLAGMSLGVAVHYYFGVFLHEPVEVGA
jgi:hypothetical protein